MTQVRIDAVDFGRVAAIMGRLPLEMQKVAFGRAAARMRSVVERNYARFASRHIRIPQKHIMSRMRSYVSGGDITLVVRSTNIPLHELGAAQRGYGVFVPGRGRYEGAFIPKASARRAAGYVLQRQGKSRLPTEMLFGPNPANAVNRTPAVYEDILVQIAHNEFATVVLRQVAFLMSRAR